MSKPEQNTLLPGEDMPEGWLLAGTTHMTGAAFTFEQATYLFATYPILQIVTCISVPRAEYVTCAAEAHRFFCGGENLMPDDSKRRTADHHGD